MGAKHKKTEGLRSLGGNSVVKCWDLLGVHWEDFEGPAEGAAIPSAFGPTQEGRRAPNSRFSGRSGCLQAASWFS